MTRLEIETWLNSVPIYQVTDRQTKKGTVKPLQLSPDSTTMVCFYFVSKIMAEAHLTQFRQVSDDNVKITTVTLGSIYFSKLLAFQQQQQSQPQSPNNNPKEMENPEQQQQQQQQQQDIEYRLVPDPRDLIMARSLLEEDGDYTGDGDDEDDGYDNDTDGDNDESDNDDDINEKDDDNNALTVRPFERIYNDIPIFALASKKTKEYYMCLSSDNLLQLMMERDSDDDDHNDDDELDSELLSLSEVVERMQQPSTTIDYRQVRLIPPTPILITESSSSSSSSNYEEGGGDGGEEQDTTVISDSFLKQQLADPQSFVADTFFTPLFLE
jgi:hypothetical protein